jgi:hypothetical protein
MKKINTKKLKSFYQTEPSHEIRAFVNDCVTNFLEYSNKISFLEDLGLLTDATT